MLCCVELYSVCVLCGCGFRASTVEDPLGRIVEITRWFISSLSASRKVKSSLILGRYVLAPRVAA